MSGAISLQSLSQPFALHVEAAPGVSSSDDRTSIRPAGNKILSVTTTNLSFKPSKLNPFADAGAIQPGDNSAPGPDDQELSLD
jgi:glutaminase